MRGPSPPDAIIDEFRPSLLKRTSYVADGCFGNSVKTAGRLDPANRGRGHLGATGKFILLDPHEGPRGPNLFATDHGI
jgi:hypothetical protein